MKHWKYYNHAILPSCAPHETVDTALIDDGEIWNINEKALLVRYTTNFDCSIPTGWWYCVKDTPIKIETMKSSKRYKVNKGLKYVEVKRISCIDYADELFECFISAVERYETYVNKMNKKVFIKSLDNNNFEYYAAFFKETGKIVAYSKNIVSDEYVNLSTIKFNPAYMKYQISAALLYIMIYDYINVQGKKYICDGERCIHHKTNIQNYLESVFGFRKAYCKLHLVYRKPLDTIIKIIFPFRKLLKCMDKIQLISYVNSILKMEEISREQTKMTL